MYEISLQCMAKTFESGKDLLHELFNYILFKLVGSIAPKELNMIPLREI